MSTPRYPHVTAALPADLQPVFDRAARENATKLARELRCEKTTIDRLMYGGRAQAVHVARVVEAMRAASFGGTR